MDEIRAHILRDGPWCFTDVLLVVKPGCKALAMAPGLFTHCDFCVNVIGLLRERYTLDVGKELGEVFGELYKVRCEYKRP